MDSDGMENPERVFLSKAGEQDTRLMSKTQGRARSPLTAHRLQHVLPGKPTSDEQEKQRSYVSAESLVA